MKLQGKFYSKIEDARDESPTYLSIIPAYDQSPKKIYPVLFYDKLFIVCENKKEMNYFVATNNIDVINERLNFTACKDVDVMLYDVCGIKKSTLQCRLSDIKNICGQMDSDATLFLEVTFKNGQVIDCKKIDNLG